jgi:hypothetical protein
MSTITWEDQFTSEIDNARLARKNRNEGKARVCARRAAGVVIAEYLLRLGDDIPSESAYNRIEYLHKLEELPPGVRETSGHFLVRVNENHQLPIEIDLINEAEWLRSILLP